MRMETRSERLDSISVASSTEVRWMAGRKGYSTYSSTVWISCCSRAAGRLCIPTVSRSLRCRRAGNRLSSVVMAWCSRPRASFAACSAAAPAALSTPISSRPMSAPKALPRKKRSLRNARPASAAPPTSSWSSCAPRLSPCWHLSCCMLMATQDRMKRRHSEASSHFCSS